MLFRSLHCMRNLYDIQMPSTLGSLHLIWSNNVFIISKCLIIILNQFFSSCKKTIQFLHLTYSKCTLNICNTVIVSKIQLLIEPRSITSCHQFGISCKGRKIGTLSDLTTFSFHPVKPITTGEGGMIMTNQEDLYQRMLLFQFFFPYKQILKHVLHLQSLTNDVFWLSHECGPCHKAVLLNEPE